MKDAPALAELNVAMVERAKAMRQIRSHRVEQAFRETPRHVFLPGVAPDLVYSGNAIVTRADPRRGVTSSSSEVAVMAVMLEALSVEEGQRVLEIGTGTGYNAALLDVLVGASGEVVTIDNQADVADDARAHLAATGHERVRVVTGDGYLGHPVRAPYDRIIATASVRDIPVSWRDQLELDGLLTVPLRLRSGTQLIATFRRSGGEGLESVTVAPGGFMPIRSEHQALDDLRRIGDEWELALASFRDGDAEAIAELLKSEPRMEPFGTVPWQVTLSLAGLVEPDWVGIRAVRGQRGMPFQGVFDRETRSLALLVAVPAPAGEPRSVVLLYGASTARDRLARLVDELRDVSIGQMRIAAIPKDARAPAADVVFDGDAFRYTVDWRAARAV